MTAGNAKHQAAVAAAAEQVVKLRADIHRQLDVVVELAAHLEDLADTRQSVGLGFITPEGRELADKQARADRLAARTPNSVPPSGPVPAPVTMPAVSASAEILFTLRHHVDRLGRRAIAAGLCLIPRLPENADIADLATRLRTLVDLITSQRRLAELLRELDHLEEISSNVVDGPAKTNHPDACPWCGRHTLVIHHREPGRDTPVIRCEGIHLCQCTDPWCPCHRPAPAHKRPRHEWVNSGRATHTWPQLAREQNHRKELMAIETKATAAVERARQLHQPRTITYPDGSVWTSFVHVPRDQAPADHVCEVVVTEPLADDDPRLWQPYCQDTGNGHSWHAVQICASCGDGGDSGDAEHAVIWPCPTYRALELDQPDVADAGADDTHE